MSYMISDAVDSYIGYQKVLEQFGFLRTGERATAWSVRYEDTQGRSVEFRASGWDLRWGHTGNQHRSGCTHTELHRTLLEFLSKQKLIEMLLTK